MNPHPRGYAPQTYVSARSTTPTQILVSVWKYYSASKPMRNYTTAFEAVSIVSGFTVPFQLSYFPDLGLGFSAVLSRDGFINSSLYQSIISILLTCRFLTCWPAILAARF